LKENGSRFAVNAFHAFAHNWACQSQFNPKYVYGFGLTDGEGSNIYIHDAAAAIVAYFCSNNGIGMERFWSYIRGYISAARSMKESRRKLFLLKAVRSFAQDKNENMG
jgi:hypothetical protein